MPSRDSGVNEKQTVVLIINGVNIIPLGLSISND